MVTLYPRDIDLKNYKLLKKFKDTTVVDNISSLKRSIKMGKMKKILLLLESLLKKV